MTIWEFTMSFSIGGLATLTCALFVPALGDDASSKFPKEHFGKWIATNAEFSGKTPPAEIIRQLWVTIKDDRMTISPLFFSDGKFSVDGELMEVKYKLNAKTKPKQID